MLFFFLLQLIESQSQFTNIDKSFIDGQSENQGWTMFTQDQNLVNSQLCDQINHTTFFSPQAGMIKLVKLPPHNKIEITYQVVVVGPPDQENPVHGWVDQYQIDQQSNNSISNCQIFQMSYNPLTHYSESSLIVIQGNGTDQQLWGIRDFIVNTHNCPNQCQRCDQEEQCELWEVVYNQTFDDQTDSIDSINSIVEFQTQNKQINITQQQLSVNYKSWISFLYISYNDDDQIILKLDNDVKTFRIINGNHPNLNSKGNRLKIMRIGYQYDNQLSNQSTVQIASKLQSWGIRDLVIYTMHSELTNQEIISSNQEANNRPLNQQNKFLQTQTSAGQCEMIHEYDLQDTRSDIEEDYFSNQYLVKNGVRGSQITSIFNGGDIIGGYQVFDQNTKVQRLFHHPPESWNFQYTFSIQLYIFGTPDPNDYIQILFRSENKQPLKILNDDQLEFKISTDFSQTQKDQFSDLYYKTLEIKKKKFIIFNSENNKIIEFKIKYVSRKYLINKVYWGFDHFSLFYSLSYGPFSMNI